MKCTKCGENNLTKAHYCKKCENPFTDQERDEAYQSTIYGKLDKFEDLKGWIDLSNITSHPVYRIVILAGLSLFVIWNVLSNGTRLRIQDTDEYDVAYNRNSEEYYVLTDKEEVAVDIYLPKEASSLTVRTYLYDVCIAAEETENTQFVLSRNEDDYYVVTAEYTDGNQEQILFFVTEGDE